MSFCLVILYKIIALAAAGSVQCAQFGPVWIMLRFSARKEPVDVELWLVGDFDLLLSRDAGNLNLKRFKKCFFSNNILRTLWALCAKRSHGIKTPCNLLFFLPHCVVCHPARCFCRVSEKRGVGIGVEAGVYLLIKECCFRFRVRVDTNPNLKPKTAFFKKKNKNKTKRNKQN